jgi:hypothetical protein
MAILYLAPLTFTECYCNFMRFLTLNLLYLLTVICFCLSPLSSERLSLFGFSLDHHQANICIKASPILPSTEGQVSSFIKFTSAHPC